MKFYFFLLFFIGLLLSAAFTTCHLLSPLAFSYFAYTISASLLAISLGLVLWRQPKEKDTTTFYRLPQIALGLYTVYVLMSSILLSKMSVLGSSMLLITSLLLLFVYSKLLKLGLLGVKSMAWLIVSLVIIEGGNCILQYLDLAPKPDVYFRVYGSLPNPNLTAMFLAMALPFNIYLLLEENGRNRFVVIASTVLLFTSLVLLECRTAFLGVLIVGAYQVGVRYQWLQRARHWLNAMNKAKSAIFLSFGLALVTLIASALYTMKIESSEGRLFVWKICGRLFQESPMFGHGYYSFERSYNMAQAEYFRDNLGNDAEQYGASYIKIAYNDFIQNAVEGGLIGLLLYFLFGASLIVPILFAKNKSTEFQLGAAGVLAFLVMSMFNSVEHTVSVSSLFILCVSILATNASGFTVSKLFSTKFAVNNQVVSILLVAIGVSLFVNQILYFRHEIELKEAKVMIKDGKNSEALRLLKPKQEPMKYSSNFWVTAGNAFYNLKKYKEALNNYKKAAKFAPTPDIFLYMANCYSKMGNYEDAKKCCMIASNLVPNRIMPHFSLFLISSEHKDTMMAVETAKKVIAHKTKGISKQAESYKEAAEKYLKNINYNSKNDEN